MKAISLSRGQHSDPEGGLIKRVDVPISESMEDDLIFIARSHNMTKAEYVRHVLNLDLYGKVSHVQTIVTRGANHNQNNVG